METREKTCTTISYKLTKEESNILYKTEDIIEKIQVLFKDKEDDFFNYLRTYDDADDDEMEIDCFWNLIAFIARIRMHSGEDFIIK